MLDRERISSVQLFLLLVITEAATAFLYAPSSVIQMVGRDSWLTPLIATISGLVVALVCIALAKKFPQQVFAEYLPQILGKIPGKLLAGIYTAVFIHLTSVILNQSSSFVHVAFLRETPLVALEILIGLASLYGAYLGIEVIARQNELVWPVWVLSILIIILLVAESINPDNFRPFLEKGIMPVIKGSALSSAFRGEIFLLLMLYPYLNKKEEVYKSAVYYLLTTAALLGTITAAIIGVFGDLIPVYMVYPAYDLARYISLARFLERIQILIVVMWMSGVIVKMAVFFHSAAIAAATTLGIRNYRVTLLPILAGTIIISRLFYSDHLSLINFLSKIFPYYGPAVELLIPALVLVIAVIFKKGGKRLT